MCISNTYREAKSRFLPLTEIMPFLNIDDI